MSFTPNNRLITINDLDQPDAVPGPQHNPIGYPDVRTVVPRQHKRVPFGIALLGTLLLLLVAGCMYLQLTHWLSSEYATNSTFSGLVQLMLYTVVVSGGVALAVCLLSLALAAFGKAAKAGLFEVPGAFSVHALDALTGWRRPAVGALATDAMQQHFGVQQTLAQQSQYRNVTAYSPSISYSYHIKPDDAASQADGGNAPALLPPAPVPPFGDLLASGVVGRGTPLLLGLDAHSGAELRGSWLDLYSTAVAGLSGGGKTTTQRFLAAQAALHGARFVICDPHYGAAEDSLGATLAALRGSLLCEVADTESTILGAVRLVADIGAQRISGQIKDATPVILWVDEATRLLGHSKLGPELAALLEQIAQQYRKRGVYGSISGQIWTADRTGGSSAFRDSLASVLCHRMKRNQARLLLPTEEARLVERLPTGHAVLWRTSGATSVIAIPNTTAADMQAVAQVLAGSAGTPQQASEVASTRRPIGFRTPPTAPTGKPDGSPVEASSNQASTAAARAETLPPEAARIVALFLAGNDVAEIVRQVYGLPSSSGRRYQELSKYVLAVLRHYMGGVHAS